MENIINAKTTLRAVEEGDLPIFFDQQKNPDAVWMAAFISRDPHDRKAFDDHWEKIQNKDNIIIRTILFENDVAGNIVSFILDGKREVGYWLGKEFWGKGLASRALYLFTEEIKERPLYAHVAFDNLGSIKVLEKNGFERIGEDTYKAKARDQEISEYIYKLI